MHEEIELKLAIAPEDVATFRQISLLPPSFEKVTLKTIYYDTYDYYLRQRGYVLRVRSEEDTRFFQTVKTSNEASDGLDKRTEWEYSVNNNLPNFELFPDHTIRQALLMTDLGDKIMPLFVTEFVRENWHVTENDTNIIVSLDQGSVNCQHLTLPISEVELELKTGDTKQLFTLAEKLQKFVNLPHLHQSKSSRGYQLARQLLREA